MTREGGRECVGTGKGRRCRAGWASLSGGGSGLHPPSPLAAPQRMLPGALPLASRSKSPARKRPSEG
eukprot:1440630-Alexandrium_andersonii.AAC.1